MTELKTQKEWFGHPRGLIYLFFAELWERFSFYGMRALLMLYMTEKVFAALEARDTISAGIYAAYGSFVYATPVLGGLLADRLLGYRKAIILGGVLMSLGHFILAIEHEIAFFSALALIIIGNGYFKPNISSFVGELYQKGDKRRDSGFTLFYMGINIGATVAPLACAFLANNYGWHYGFGLAGIGMVSGLLVFLDGIRKGIFQDKGLPPSEEVLEKKFSGLKLKTFVPVASFVLVPIIALMMYHGDMVLPLIGKVHTEGGAVNYLFWFILLVIVINLVRTMMGITVKERLKLIVALFFTLFITLFWAFYEMSGSTLTLFAQRNVNLSIIDAKGTNALTGFFIVVLAIPFSWFWSYLNNINKNPRAPIKYFIGLFFLGVGYYIFFLSKDFADPEGKVPMFYLVLGYFFFCFGEMFVSPVGLSKVTELTPKKAVSFMMGVWFLAVAFAFRVIDIMSKKLAISGSKENMASAQETLEIYTQGFEQIAYVAFGGAVFALILVPILNKWMDDVR